MPTQEEIKTAILSSAYLPPIQYFTKLIKYKEVLIEQFDNYNKQTYRNRCQILSPNGPLSLSIPVEKESKKVKMKEVKISEHDNWRHQHWNAIESAYNNTPYFLYYQDYFAPFYEKKYTYLLDYNLDLLTLICDLIDIDPNWQLTTEYLETPSKDKDDFRELIHPKIEESIDPNFISLPYYQVFRHKYKFCSNLSIIDLLFNMGPESLVLLTTSYK